MSRITHLLFTIASDSRLLISITLRCASTIAYTFLDCCTSTYIFMDGCTFTWMTFSSLALFYLVYASTKCCSTTSYSSNFSMNTKSTNVAPGFVRSLTRQCLLLLLKNSTADVPVVFISWIIICTNYIFSLYAFPSTHPKMMMNVMVTL